MNYQIKSLLLLVTWLISVAFFVAGVADVFYGVSL